jgi:beta-glucanase (GH16 family)
MVKYSSLGLLAALLTPVFAQTTTDCDPTKGQCAPDPALGMSYTWNMTNTTLDTSQNVWNITQGVINYNDNAAQFVINKKGDAPTIKTNFRIFWGSVSLVMKLASGQGIISTLTMLSDDLDEIDWEFIGSNNTHIETNYFGKGNHTVYDRAIYVPVSNPRTTFHNYTVEWTTDWLVWMIDNQVVRNMTRGQADGNGAQYPQTPLDIRLGIWSAGDSDQPGTVEWAGGKTDYSQAPFTMEIQSVQINDYTKNVSAYTYSDTSGSSASIKTTP